MESSVNPPGRRIVEDEIIEQFPVSARPIIEPLAPVVAVQPPLAVAQAHPVVASPTIIPPPSIVGVQPQVVAQPVVGVQPQVVAQPVVSVQPAASVQPVYQQLAVPQAVPQQVVQQVVPQAVITGQPLRRAAENDTVRSFAEVGDTTVETVRQGYYDASGNLMEREEQVYDDPYARRMNTLDRTSRIIYFIMGAVQVVLALRFLFRVLNADSTNGFASFIYKLSAPFVGPFNGITNDQGLGQGSVVEISTLIAMVVYAILTYGLIQLLYLLLTPNRSTRDVFSTTRRRRF